VKYRLVIAHHSLTPWEDEWELVYGQLRRRLDAEMSAVVNETQEKQTAARLRQLLESYEGTKQ
jgi:predicted kinase